MRQDPPDVKVVHDVRSPPSPKADLGAAARGRRVRRRPVIRRGGLWAPFVVAFAGCGILEADANGGVDDLALARARWEAAALADYDLEMTRLCFCAFVGDVRVEVRGGVRTAVVVVGEEAVQPLDSGLEPYYPTVEGLFEIVEQALADEVAELRVTYHPALGYPVELWVDTSLAVSDEEFGYDVLLSLPTPGS